MEMYISLSHEIRVGENQPETAAQPTDTEKRLLDEQERQRIIDTYGVDATKEEIEEKEKDRIEQEQEKAEENKRTMPENHGQKVPDDESELNATKIQNEHDDQINQ